MTSKEILSARNRSRSGAGSNTGSLPQPIRKMSIAAFSLNTRASEARSISAALRGGQAHMPLGNESSDPLCDISAKRNPPAP